MLQAVSREGCSILLQVPGVGSVDALSEPPRLRPGCGGPRWVGEERSVCLPTVVAWSTPDLHEPWGRGRSFLPPGKLRLRVVAGLRLQSWDAQQERIGTLSCDLLLCLPQFTLKSQDSLAGL